MPRASRLLFRIARLLFGLSLPVCLAGAEEFERVESSGKHFTVCRVDLDRERLELFWKSDSGVTFKSFATLDRWLRVRERKLVFAMNAGMYHGDFSPVGLYVENGRELSPLNLQNNDGNFFLKPNGVFVITAHGARVIESSQLAGMKDKPLLATQSGPMLVIDRQIHPKFSADSTSRLFRNGVGVVSPKQVVFAISDEPVNFHEFALMFRDRLHCNNALFLDGTISSLFSGKLNRADKKMDLGPIIGIAAPLK